MWAWRVFVCGCVFLFKHFLAFLKALPEAATVNSKLLREFQKLAFKISENVEIIFSFLERVWGKKKTSI